MPGEYAEIAPPDHRDVSAEGYRSAGYVRSLSQYGVPVFLPESGGWLLKRAIPGSGLFDATGPYPIFCCSNWRRLGADLDALGGDIVSVSLVKDPLASVTDAELREMFDVVTPHSEHFVVDTDAPSQISKSHMANARRALRKVDVEICADPAAHLDDWVRLYGVLIDKHDISGMRAFSREAFRAQLSAPGLVMFRAVAEGRTVGLDLWYVDGDAAQGHLAAFSAEGYRLGASYATKLTLIRYFSDRVRWINLGGLPGGNAASSGLRHFKSGWANTTKRAHICGRILDRATYQRLSGPSPRQDWFPAYRAGEFT